MKLLQPQIFQFAQTQTGSVGQLQNCLVAQAFRCFGVFRREQFFNFIVRQRFWQSLPTARQRKIFRDVRGQKFFVLGEFIKRPQRGDFQINTFAAQALGGFLRLVGERARALVREKRHQMFQFNRFPLREILFCRPIGEFAEQRGVSFRRVVRLPALVAQVLQKIFDERLHYQVCSERFVAGNLPFGK